MPKGPILYSPVDNKFPIRAEFWEDFSSHPIKKNYYRIFANHHPGVDFELPVGSKVTAAFAGKVVRREFHVGMGNVIGIRNGNILGLYAHLSEFKVRKGQQVLTGQIIGFSGHTGAANATTPHLHFELRDITKRQLREMVFKPEFNQSIRQWQPFWKRVANFFFLIRVVRWEILRRLFS